jgi:hypothetical protein
MAWLRHGQSQILSELLSRRFKSSISGDSIVLDSSIVLRNKGGLEFLLSRVANDEMMKLVASMLQAVMGCHGSGVVLQSLRE